MDHRALIAVIPIPEWNPGHQVLFINETHELTSQKTPVGIAEIVQSKSRLPKCMDRTAGPNRCSHDGKAGTDKSC